MRKRALATNRIFGNLLISQDEVSLLRHQHPLNEPSAPMQRAYIDCSNFFHNLGMIYLRVARVPAGSATLCLSSHFFLRYEHNIIRVPI